MRILGCPRCRRTFQGSEVEGTECPACGSSLLPSGRSALESSQGNQEPTRTSTFGFMVVEIRNGCGEVLVANPCFSF